MSLSYFQREQIRLSLLRYAEAASGNGFTLPLMTQMLRAEGFAVKAEDVRREAEYLEDKELLAVVPKNISPENTAWRVTATGRDYLARNQS